MGLMDNKVALVTGAGRGIGREVALNLAASGAKVVINDLGGDLGGEGGDATPAQAVADEIAKAGGEAIVNGDSVSDPDGAKRMIDRTSGAAAPWHRIDANSKKRARLQAFEILLDTLGEGIDIEDPEVSPLVQAFFDDH